TSSRNSRHSSSLRSGLMTSSERRPTAKAASLSSRFTFHLPFRRAFLPQQRDEQVVRQGSHRLGVVLQVAGHPPPGQPRQPAHAVCHNEEHQERAQQHVIPPCAAALPWLPSVRPPWRGTAR